VRCRSAQRWLSESFDDGSVALPAPVIDHVRTCRACARFETGSTVVRGFLRDEARAGDPVQRLQTAARTSGGRQRPRRTAISTAVAAGVALLLAAGGAWLALDRDGEAGNPGGVETERFPVVPRETAALLVWTAGGLPEDATDALGRVDTIEQATVVAGDQIMLPSGQPDGVYFLDALAVDPATYAPFLPEVPARAIRSLTSDTAILGSTSAQLRALHAGDSIAVAGRDLRIVAVLDDELIGAAEVVVARGAVPTIATPRYALVAYSGSRGEVEGQLRAELGAAIGIRFRAVGEARILRHGDAVLPQAWIKRDFGEFRAIPNDDGSLTVDDAFTSANITTFELPVIGEVRCHRLLREPLTQALADLPTATASPLRDAIVQCFDPRVGEPGLGPSRHSWGVAIDLDIEAPVKGGRPVAPEGLVEAFAAAGFTWGGDWLVPDPGRFEWIGDLGNS